MGEKKSKKTGGTVWCKTNIQIAAGSEQKASD
jgi:hypothetical protein